MADVATFTAFLIGTMIGSASPQYNQQPQVKPQQPAVVQQCDAHAFGNCLQDRTNFNLTTMSGTKHVPKHSLYVDQAGAYWMQDPLKQWYVGYDCVPKAYGVNCQSFQMQLDTRRKWK